MEQKVVLMSMPQPLTCFANILINEKSISQPPALLIFTVSYTANIYAMCLFLAMLIFMQCAHINIYAMCLLRCKIFSHILKSKLELNSKMSNSSYQTGGGE